MESVESLDNVHGYHDKVQGAHSDWTLSMDSLDIVHGLSGIAGHCPLIPGQSSTESMDSLDIVHGLSGHCPWNQWKVWTMSMDTMTKSREPTQTGHCPWTPSGHSSMDSVEYLDIVQFVH